MIDKKKHFGRKTHCVLLIFFYSFLIVGCDQIKSRLFSSSESILNYGDNVEKDKDLKTKKVDDQLLNSSNHDSIPIIKQNDQNNDIQLELIRENSKKTTNENSYSVIGTDRGKPFRDSSSRRVKSD